MIDFLADYGEAVEESQRRQKAQQAVLAMIKARSKRRR